MKKFKKFLKENNGDNDDSVIYNKKTKQIISKVKKYKDNMSDMIKVHNFHPDLTVIRDAERHIYNVPSFKQVSR